MRIRLMGWPAKCIIAAAVVGLAYGAWAIFKAPVPEIPRPGTSAFTDREVQEDVTKAAQRVELNPKSAAAWGEYGIVLRAYLQHPEADRCFQVAADLDPTDGRWPYLLGVRLAETDPTAALVWLERAARATVPPAAKESVRARLAELLLQTGQPADALTALGPDPGASEPRIRLAAARAAAGVGDDRSADEFLGDLTDYPTSARQALLLRSEICRRQGRTSYADYLAERAAEVPDAPWPDPLTDPIQSRDLSHGGRLDEAARLLRAGKPAEAERLLLPLTTAPTTSDARAFVGLAESRLMQGNRTGALAALDQAIKVDPKNLAANYQTGLIHFDAGEKLWAAGRADEARAEIREAVVWLDKVLALNPDFAKGLILKGAALHRFLGQNESALTLLRRYVELRPLVMEGHLELGEALTEAGQLDVAAGSLRRAAELARPGDRRAADALAKLAQSGGK